MPTIHYILRTGDSKNGSNFYNSVVLNISKKRPPIWGFNKNRQTIRKVERINEDVKKGFRVLIWLHPSGVDKPWCVLRVKKIKERQIDKFIKLDNDNQENGWNQTTAFGNSGFEYLIKYDRFYFIKDTQYKYKSTINKRCPSPMIYVNDRMMSNSLTQEYKNIARYNGSIYCC